MVSILCNATSREIVFLCKSKDFVIAHICAFDFFLGEHNLSPSICMWFRVLLNQFASDFHKKMSPFLSCPINPTDLSKFQLAFQKFDHLSCRRNLKLKRNVVNGFKKGVIVRNIPHVKWSNF